MKRGRKSKYNDIEIIQAKWNAALYIRLSVQDGDKSESNSIVNQKELLDMFIRQYEELDFYNYYIDDGFSGTNFERPGFKKMIEDINASLVNTVIVKDLSRLGRNYIEIGKCIENVFLKKNIRFISVCDNIDSHKNIKSIEDISFPLKNLINETYCKDISKKITSSLEIMKKQGKYIGSFPPFGYVKEKENKHHLIIDKASSTVVKMIFDLCESGMGNTLIAKELNQRCILTPSEYNYKILKLIPTGKKISKEWTPSMIGKILDNRVYCGDLIQNKTHGISYKVHKRVKNSEDKYIVVENTHEPIIDKERFYNIQELRKNRKFNWNKRVENIDIFDGLIVCSSCKSQMTRIITSTKEITEIPIKKYAYKCNTCNKKEEKDFYIKADTLKICIFRSIKYHIDLLNDFENAQKAIRHNTDYTESLKEKVENMKKELEQLEKQKSENYEKWKNDEITEIEYIENIKNNVTQECSLQKEIKDEKSKLLTARQEIKNIRDNSWVTNLLKYKNQRKLTKEMLDDLIEKIYINKDGRKIKLKFKYEDTYNGAMNYLKIVKKGGDINA